MRLLSMASALLLGIVLTLMGCGGSSSTFNPNPNNLTPAQAQQLGNEAYVDVGTALADALGGSPLTNDRTKILAALRKNNQAVSASAQTTCNSSDTSCIVSFNYGCPDGGSIALSGSFTENDLTSASGCPG